MRQAFLDFSLDPDGLFYYFWERLIVVMIVATFFLNTYVAFFESYSSLLDDSTGYVVFVFGYTMDMFFYVDFALKFVTQITTANGKISNHRDMTRNFLRSFWCWLDIIALFPFEIIVAGMQQLPGEQSADYYTRQMRDLGYLRLNRCLRVFLLPRFFDKLSDQLATSTASVRALKFCLYIAISSQLGAAILVAGTCTPEHCPENDATTNSTSWTSATPPNITQDFTFDYRYSSSLYYAVTLLTSAGYGDIFPHTVMEQFLANVVMLIGLLVYGYCLAILTATLANLDGPRVEFQERLFAVKKFMEYNKMAELVKCRAIEVSMNRLLEYCPTDKSCY